MSTNQELMKKADWAVADLNSNGGALEPEQADQFIRLVLKQPTMLKSARHVTMGASERKINRIGFGSRILRAGTSNTALAVADRAKPTTDQITLTSKEVVAEIRLPYDVIEDNIERGNIGQMEGGYGDVTGGIKDTIMQLIAERAALDLEELGLLGDTANGTDSFLAQHDGFLKLSTLHDVDNASAGITKTLFKKGAQAMPSQYMRNTNLLRHYISPFQEFEYRDTLSDRETVVGDANIQGTQPVFGMGIQIERAALMPDAKGLLTFPKNLIWGIQRKITVETDKDISARVYIIVLSARVAFAIETPDAVVRYLNI